jgi:tetratricopeptide (TPR) repeat protein
MKKILFLINIFLVLNSYAQTKKSQQLNEKSGELFLAGEYNKSIELINEAIELSPNWAQLYNGRGAVYYMLDKFNLALSDLNKAIGLEPSEKSYFNGGLVYEELQNNQAALYDYNKAVELKSNSARSFHKIAFIKFNTKDFVGAKQAIDKAIEINNDPSYIELQIEIRIKLEVGNNDSEYKTVVIGNQT